MRLDDETYEYIKGEVIHLLIHYDIKCIPISGFELANKMGMILVPYSSLSLKKKEAAKKTSPDGFYLELDNGKEYIFYDDKVGYERCNMTILHEIGHAVLGHTDDMDSEVAESEASFFAKYVAAPPPLVHQVHPENPQKIMNVFRLSYEAACNEMNYYQKWINVFSHRGKYVSYEQQLLVLFQYMSEVKSM